MHKSKDRIIPNEAYFIEQIIDKNGKNRTSRDLRDKENQLDHRGYGNTEEYDNHIFNKLCRGETISHRDQLSDYYNQCHITTNNEPYFTLGKYKYWVFFIEGQVRISYKMLKISLFRCGSISSIGPGLSVSQS